MVKKEDLLWIGVTEADIAEREETGSFSKATTEKIKNSSLNPANADNMEEEVTDNTTPVDWTTEWLINAETEEINRSNSALVDYEKQAKERLAEEKRLADERIKQEEIFAKEQSNIIKTGDERITKLEA
jgi:hypothetical protein